ncbi:MAG: hypothetical protein J7498_01220 [Sphingobium sp.]|nr:hypothetical protein [Sphingobium sp.]
MSTNGLPLRLRGTLRIGERGPVLETEDGPVWRLETSDDLGDRCDQQVQIEGFRRGPGSLELLWIGSTGD